MTALLVLQSLLATDSNFNMNLLNRKSLTDVGLFFILILNLFTLFSCTKTPQTPPQSTVRVAVRYFPYTFDWNKNTSINGFNEALAEPLITYDFSKPNPHLAPALATQWRAHNNAQTWTITLRKNLKWSDGAPIKAEHFLNSFKRFLAPKTAAPLASILYPIKNARRFNQGQIKFTQVGIKITSPHTLEFHLKHPLNHFPHLLTLHQLSPISYDHLKLEKKGWQTGQNLIVSGPYLVKSHTPNQKLILKSNPQYWAGERKVKTLIGYNVPDPNTALNLFESGKVDLAFSLPTEELRRLQSSKKFYKTEGSSPAALIFDTHFAFNKNHYLKQAIHHAIDRQQLLKINPLIKAELRWLPQIFTPGHKPPQGRTIQHAKNLLKKANLPKSFRLPLFISNNSNERRIAENLQYQLKTKLNLNLDIKTLDEKQLQALAQEHQIPLRIATMGPDYFHPHSLMEFFTSQSSQNILNWKNSTYDQLINLAASSLNPQESLKAYLKANELIYNTAPIVPLFTYVYPYLISNRISGFSMPPIYRINFTSLSVKNR